jgi:1-acyl-sn-glycerol-3-phosphate acyltransferase
MLLANDERQSLGLCIDAKGGVSSSPARTTEGRCSDGGFVVAADIDVGEKVSFVNFVYAPFMWVIIVVFSIFWPFLMVLSLPFSLIVDKRRVFIHRLAILWARSVVGSIPGFRCEIIGKENLPKSNFPVIFVANHQSQVDILVLCLLGVQFRWMAKESLFRIPLFGWAMSAAGYVPVNRSSVRGGKRSMILARRVLDSGISMAFFPEGTRSADGTLGAFKAGAFALATQTMVPVVPLSIVGAASALPKGGFVPRHCSFRIVVHPAIQPQGSDASQISNEARSAIASALTAASRF